MLPSVYRPFTDVMLKYTQFPQRIRITCERYVGRSNTWPRHHSLGKSRVLNMYIQIGYIKRMPKCNIVYMLEVVTHESDSNDYHDHILYMKLFITYQYAFKIMLHIWTKNVIEIIKEQEFWKALKTQ